jgi:hypothetical protein
MRFYSLVILLICPLILNAQSSVFSPNAQPGEIPRYQIYGGYSYLSNSFNGVPGARSGLAGWDASLAFPAWRGLRFKVDVAHYSGTNSGAQQNALSIMGGFQYERTFHRERLFVESLFGDVGLNRYWGPNGSPGETASFSTLLGGGVDTPINSHVALRVQGDWRHTNFALTQSTTLIPYRLPGEPQSFGSFSAGMVWMPKLGSPQNREPSEYPVPSELTFEDLNSFGHYHVFAVTWWSYLHVAGVEYDRHSWGKLLGSQVDYAAEFLPVVLLSQPSKTDIWGNPLTTAHETVPGVGLSPIGVRLMWREGRAWKPYYLIKAGGILYSQKVLSQYASYFVFSLQQSVGIQFRVNDRWDVRTGVGDFHFSNAFIVPSNPGIDEMTYSVALTRQFGKQPSSY